MLSIAILVLCVSCVFGTDIPTIYEWKHLDYNWLSKDDKNAAIDSGTYDYKHVVPYDIRTHKDRIFITTPKFFVTNPASLSTIPTKSGERSPLLTPYPNWKWHTGDRCLGIISALKVTSDNCNRLWVVDSGMIGNERLCPPKILIFDLNTDELLKRVEIPEAVSKNGTIQVETIETKGNNCGEFWAYMTDVADSAILIYNGSSIWRYENEAFAPTDVDFTVDGETAHLPYRVGPAAVLLAPRNVVQGGFAGIFALASRKPIITTIDELHDSDSKPVRLLTTPFSFPSQIIGTTSSRDGVIFFGFITEMNLLCWSPDRPLVGEMSHLILEDRERLKVVCSITISEDDYGVETLWLVVNSYISYVLGTIDWNQSNFRILSAPVTDLIEGTVCQPKNSETPLAIEELGLIPVREHC